MLLYSLLLGLGAALYDVVSSSLFQGSVDWNLEVVVPSQLINDPPFLATENFALPGATLYIDSFCDTITFARFAAGACKIKPPFAI
jgi:hypothetical protein